MSDQHMLSDRDRREIQGLVLYGTTCPLLRYHFFQIADAVGGRRFVRSLVDSESPVQVSTAGSRDQNAASQTLVYAGFTWRGLEALAVSTVSLGSFPLEFQQGAKGRASQLGDAGESAPDRWLFDADAAHVAVVVYARQQDDLDTLSRQLLDMASTHACVLISMLDGEALKDFTHPSGQEVTRPLHFGYSDGISQPELLPALDRRPGTPPSVAPGMFILGHPDTSEGPPSAASAPLPIPAALGHNGTYAAFRMLEQDVDGYEEYLDSHASGPEARELLARGADALAAVRLIRRGMPYGPAYDPSHKRDGNPRGLLGLFLCANLKDQFEAVMSRWISAPEGASPQSPIFNLQSSIFNLRPP